MQAVLDGYGLVEHRGGCVVVPREPLTFIGRPTS